MISEAAQPLRICCYCSSYTEDRTLCARLIDHFKPLERKYRLTIWSNKDVSAGSEVKKEIDKHLISADIILLLISPDFLASDDLYSTVLEPALKRRAEANVNVLPVILRPSDWENTPLKELQVLPEGQKPIISWERQDDAFLDIIQTIDRVVRMRSTPDSPSYSSLSFNKREKTFIDSEALLPTRELWTNGNETIIHRFRYSIYHTEPVWAKDGSALLQQAKARQLDGSRMVWLKQVRIFRSNASEAGTWAGDLEKEAKLLDELEQEQGRFPRRLEMWSDSHEKTLIYMAFSGNSLASTFGNGDKPVDPPLIRRLLRSLPPLCFMLQALHKKGLAHRMLTPATILLIKGQYATVQDVGLAAVLPKRGEGPELYRAPEQIRLIPEAATRRSATDVYQLGTMLYHMLTGHLPQTLFPGEKAVAPSEWSPAIPKQLDEVLLHAIQPNPAERCNMGTFAQKLESISRRA